MSRSGSFGITALLLLWGGGTALAFWHFEGQYLRPVSRPAGAVTARPEALLPSPYAALTTEEGVVRLAGPEPVTVLNFWNPHCPCSRFAEGDVRKLIRDYQGSGVRFVTIIAAPRPQDQREALAAWRSRGIVGTDAVADADNHLAQRFGVWAAPAAVILDTKGRVAYVGAYNAARYCHDPRTAWAAKALAAITYGQKPPRAKTLFFGCQLLSSTH